MTSIKSKLLTLAATATLALSSNVFAASQADFDKAYAAAEAEIKKASAMKNEWRDTGKMMKKAQKAAKEGNFDKAIGLANKAKVQGELAQEQAASQAKAGNPGYLY